MESETDPSPIPPTVKIGKTKLVISIAAAFFLNLSGLGLGYLWLGRWLRWRIYFLVTAALGLALFSTNAYQFPKVWPLAAAGWLLWMGVDGGIQALTVRKEKPCRTFRLIIAIALAAAVLGAESAAYFNYNLFALYTSQDAISAYQSGDCEAANLHFSQLPKWYRLSLSVDVKNAEERITECRLLLHTVNASEFGIYQEAISSAEKFLEIYPESPLASRVSEAAASSFYSWGEKAREEGNYQQALDQYMTALESYPSSTKVSGLREAIASLNLLQGDQFAEKGDWKQATENYDLILKQYPETQAASQTPLKAASVYAQWGDQLYYQGDHVGAIEKYQVILNDYSWITPVQPNPEKVTTGLTEWGEELFSEGNYSEAIDKYQLLITKYRSTIPSMMIRYRIAEMYYQWAQELRKSDNFEGTFNNYGVINNFYSDTPVAERAKVEVPQLYFDWVADLQSKNEYETALEKLNLVITGFDDEAAKATAREGIPENYVLWGIFLSSQNNYLEAMEKYLMVSEDINNPLEIRNKAESGYEEALKALAADTKGQGYEIFVEAYNNACNELPSTSPAIDLDKNKPGKGLACPGSQFDLPVDLWATAPIDFRYVIKTVFSAEEVERCNYSSGYSLVRKRNFVDLALIEVRSGKVAAGKRFFGSYPENCTAKFSFTEKEQTIFGSTDFGYGDWYRQVSGQ